jgi:hypothetical protein
MYFREIGFYLNLINDIKQVNDKQIASHSPQSGILMNPGSTPGGKFGNPVKIRRKYNLNVKENVDDDVDDNGSLNEANVGDINQVEKVNQVDKIINQAEKFKDEFKDHQDGELVKVRNDNRHSNSDQDREPGGTKGGTKWTAQEKPSYQIGSEDD